MSRSFREVLYLSPLCLQLREGLHVFPRTPGTGLPKLVHVSARRRHRNWWRPESIRRKGLRIGSGQTVLPCVRREGNLVPSSARIKTFSSEIKRIPEPKQTKTQAKSQVRRAMIGQMHPPPPPIKGRRQKINENKTKTKGFSKQET